MLPLSRASVGKPDAVQGENGKAVSVVGGNFRLKGTAVFQNAVPQRKPGIYPGGGAAAKPYGNEEQKKFTQRDDRLI